MSWKGIIAIILGIWFIVAAFIPTLVGQGNLVNSLIVGIILAVVGFMMVPSGAVWQGWIVAVIGGVWMIISSFIPAITGSGTASMVNYLVVGIIVIIVSLFERSKTLA